MAPPTSGAASPTKAKANAPAMPDEEKVVEAKGKLERKKSDNILSAETARKSSVVLRADWAKTAGVKSKGKGKGKGKKSKGKGKGEHWVPKNSSEETRKEAVDRLDKKMERKQRDSISEMVKIDKMLAPKKPKWKKVNKVQPEAKGLNLMLKCVKCSKVEGDADIWEAVCGDETGVVTFSLRNKEHVDACKPGASLRCQNGKVIMVKSFIRISCDKWAIFKAADKECDFEVKADNNLSATEYELTQD